jgi:hypothetical protein
LEVEEVQAAVSTFKPLTCKVLVSYPQREALERVLAEVVAYPYN